jgi:hypothetical protein
VAKCRGRSPTRLRPAHPSESVRLWLVPTRTRYDSPYRYSPTLTSRRYSPDGPVRSSHNPPNPSPNGSIDARITRWVAKSQHQPAPRAQRSANSTQHNSCPSKMEASDWLESVGSKGRVSVGWLKKAKKAWFPRSSGHGRAGSDRLPHLYRRLLIYKGRAPVRPFNPDTSCRSRLQIPLYTISPRRTPVVPPQFLQPPRSASFTPH